MKVAVNICFILCLTICAKAQTKKTILININSTYKGENLRFDSTNYLLPNTNDSILFTNFKFYITNVKLLYNSKIIFKEKNSYHLINSKKKEKTSIKLAIPSALHFNSIEFNLGVDSVTNANGIRGGDLDPINGMYWAWHSGYINIKLEGNSKICKTRNNAFEFHLGGFQHPFYFSQKVSLPIKINKTNIIKIDTDIFKFISAIDLKSVNQIMTPSMQTIELSKKIATIFSIKE